MDLFHLETYLWLFEIQSSISKGGSGESQKLRPCPKPGHKERVEWNALS